MGKCNFVGARGSTPREITYGAWALRGIGIGIGSHQIAIANSINAETAIRINEYIYGSLMNENRMNAEHRTGIRRRAKELSNKIRQRIAQHPEAHRCEEGGFTQ